MVKLTDFQSYTHGIAKKDDTLHVDVDLYFEGHAEKVKLCRCTLYMGRLGRYGNPAEMAGKVREDLRKLKGKTVNVLRDSVDGSIDLLDAEGTVLFSMEAEEVRGADWIPSYSSEERIQNGNHVPSVD